MQDYEIYVFCNECSEVHPMSIKISLKDGPTKKQSINDVYEGEELPENIANLLNNKVRCPKTGKMFVQKDNHQVFIVPV